MRLPEVLLGIFCHRMRYRSYVTCPSCCRGGHLATQGGKSTCFPDEREEQCVFPPQTEEESEQTALSSAHDLRSGQLYGQCLPQPHPPWVGAGFFPEFKLSLVERQKTECSSFHRGSLNHGENLAIYGDASSPGLVFESSSRRA